MYKKYFAVAFVAASIAFSSFQKDNVQQKDNELSAAEKKAGWILLFDGKTTNNWRTYQNKPEDSWQVINGELYCKKDGVQHRADLVTREKYAIFEIQFDGKVSKGANSGLYITCRKRTMDRMRPDP